MILSRKGKKPTVEEMLAKAKRPGEMAPRFHRFYKGKVQVMPKCAISSPKDFAIWYTPGVAAPCREIHADPDKSFELTNRWNYVAVVSDGTRVLGLGDIGPEAAMPVMEGKALLFKYLGGVDAFPICLATKDPEELISAVKWLAPTFGGFNLEDIASPKCFYILERLRKEMDIPVWHDDQQGSALTVLAGLINALKLAGKKLAEVKITIFGAGGAGLPVANTLLEAGARGEHMIVTDKHGILHDGFEPMNEYQKKLAEATNPKKVKGENADAVKGADVVIAFTGVPGLITKEMVRSMAGGAIVFAMSNPVPEIWPWEAKEAGAKIVATGRSDLPNQINNSLGFPAVFRGALDVRARSITDEMCITAAQELAKFAEERGINEEDILPRMEEWEFYPRVAVACALKAIEQGVARIKPGRQELHKKAVAMIKNVRQSQKLLMKKGLIEKPPIPW